MSNRTYRIEPQRRGDCGYEACLPHQAQRIAVIEVTHVPARLGRRKFHHQRMLEYFTGSGAMERASQRLARLTAGNNRRDPKPRELWGRSCTAREYDEIMGRKRPYGDF